MSLLSEGLKMTSRCQRAYSDEYTGEITGEKNQSYAKMSVIAKFSSEPLEL